MALCELISIGDEILSGNTVNTNAAFIAQELEQLGISCACHTALPDDPTVLHGHLAEALERTSLVITTGGLGPTLDDRTRRVLADLFNCDLVHNPIVFEHLQQFFAQKFASLEDQSTIPSKAQPFLNRVGTAPGLLLQEGRRCLIALPGVPDEMRALMIEQVVPWVRTQGFTQQQLLTRTINICRLPESKVDSFIRKIEPMHPECTFGIYPGLWTVKVLIRGAFATGEGQQALDRAEKDLQSYLGQHVFPSSSPSLAHAVQSLFCKQGMTLSVAESCTGGNLAASLTSVPGSSGYFLGSIVSYSNALKQSLLGVQESTLHTHGAVSEETVREMARGVQRLTGSDYALSTSGIAGPGGGSSAKPVGTVYFALAKPNASVESWCLKCKGDRNRIIQIASTEALASLWESVSTIDT